MILRKRILAFVIRLFWPDCQEIELGLLCVY